MRSPGAPLLLLCNRREDAVDLLRDDREHLDLDTVELIEARPRAWAEVAVMRILSLPAHPPPARCISAIYLSAIYLGTRLREAGEHAAERLVVEAVGALYV